MCLSIPSRIVAIDEDNVATVETMGVQRAVSLDLLPEEARIGEYVLVHVGFAMGKIDEADALESLALYREMIDRMEEEEKRSLIEADDACPNRGDG